jgi:hypothetical protein
VLLRKKLRRGIHTNSHPRLHGGPGVARKVGPETGIDCSEFCRDPGQKTSEVGNTPQWLQIPISRQVCNNQSEPHSSEEIASLELLTEGL